MHCSNLTLWGCNNSIVCVSMLEKIDKIADIQTGRFAQFDNKSTIFDCQCVSLQNMCVPLKGMTNWAQCLSFTNTVLDESSQHNDVRL